MHIYKRLCLFGRFLIGLMAITAFIFGPAPLVGRAELTQLKQDELKTSGIWETGFHVPGVAGSVYALAQDSSGNIYVGGEIASAGGISVDNIAKWDGTTWVDIGGITRTSGTAYVAAMAVDSSGNLYVGGYFDMAGSVPVHNIAKWNGTTWQSLGNGTNGSVMAIELISDVHLIAGGGFTQAGAASVNNIASWNGSSWQALGSGVDDTVYAIEMDSANNALFVGGDFANAGGSPAIRVARYDLTSFAWTPLGTGLTGGGTVYDLLLIPGSGLSYNLYVAGEFGEVASFAAVGIARWDGSSWYALDYGVNGPVQSINVVDSVLYVGGDFSAAGTGLSIPTNNIAKWNGLSWSAAGAGAGTESYDEVSAIIVTSADHVVIGGDFEQAAGLVVNNLADWDHTGSVWRGMDGGLGLNGTVDTLFSYGDSVVAGGSFTQAGSTQVYGIGQLTGTAWSAFGDGVSLFTRDVVTPDGVTFYAGGAFSTAGTVPADNIARWNGSAWSELGGGTNGYVNALATHNGNLFIGGEFTTVNTSLVVNHIARWDGANWHTLGEGLDGNVESMAFDASGNLFVGGSFTYAGDLYVNHIAMWDGTQWHALGGGTSGIVYSLVCDSDNKVYAGGYFSTAGGTHVNGVGMWNGAAWSALGTGMNDGVAGLAVDADQYLYAGGDFDQAGGSAANHIARWDGFSWSALGSGTDSNVRELAVNGNRLFAGGVFKQAGGVVSHNIGVYNFPAIQQAPSPTITNLVPDHSPTGGSAFWLSVNGTNFSSRSVVRWNGVNLLTTYINGGQLNAYIPADKLTSPGVVDITVYTPAASGGGESQPDTFTIGTVEVFIPLVLR